MTARRTNQQRRARRPARQVDSGDLWRAVPTLEPQQAIRPVEDPTALIDSLGPPPLGTRSTVGQHYFAAVVERAAAIATALAASAGVLADPESD